MRWLTKAESLAEARRLAGHLQRHGVRTSIELRTGAGGNHWGHLLHRAEMSHHIVSLRSQGLTPFYSLVRNGRGGTSPVPGPLCNGYGGFDLVYRIVTMGLANHPGAGGPITLDGVTIPQDDGRYYTWGTEFEGGWNLDDWTPEFREFMGSSNAAIIDWLSERHGGRITDDSHMEHSDWARPKGRKRDREGYTRASGIAEIKAARARLAPQPQETTQEGEIMQEYLFVSEDAQGRKHHYGTMAPNTYVYIEDEAAYIKGRESLGRKVEWWPNIANDRFVGRPREAFGEYVGPEGFRPKNG